MKKHYKFSILLLTTLLAACTNTYNTIDDKGKVSGDIVFPEKEDATMPRGIFVSTSEVDKILPGITKKDLYRTIGRPHFTEMNGASEWNYILNFRQQGQTAKACLLKVIFDSDKVVTSLYWQPKACYDSVKAQTK